MVPSLGYYEYARKLILRCHSVWFVIFFFHFPKESMAHACPIQSNFRHYYTATNTIQFENPNIINIMHPVHISDNVIDKLNNLAYTNKFRTKQL